jgi:membrane protein DedA with SNARE-associated domain
VDTLLSTLAAWIVSAISAAGYLGVLGLMAVESAGVPVPSEVVMPFAGYLVSTGRFDLYIAATVGAVGCNLGSTFGYYVAAWGGRPTIERWGRYLLLRPDELGRAERFFARYGALAVFVGRLLPVIRTYIAFPAGLARMPTGRFQLFTFLGSWPWCLGLAYVGKLLGARWNSDPSLRGLFHEFDIGIAIALVLALGAFVWSRWRAQPSR